MSNALDQSIINELQSMYMRNITAFQKNVPSLYEYFKNYKPVFNHLGIDDNNEYNIWCQNHWLYQDSPRDYCIKQAEISTQKPHLIKTITDLQELDTSKIRFLDQIFSEKLKQVIKTDKTDTTPNYKFTPSIIILGIGLGHHILEVLKRKRCQELYLYEPNMDFFYASLFTFDYENLIRQFSKDISIHFLIGKNWADLAHLIRTKKTEKGFHTAVELHIIKHYNAESILKTEESLKNDFTRMFSQTGFIEDENIGISHFLPKLNTTELFLKSRENHKESKLPMAIIIGSGPSIDEQIEILHKLKDKCIIFSCSSSIEILQNNNIVPDFHVEVERQHFMINRLKLLNNSEILKKTTLLSLNPTHPDLKCYFNKNITGLKFNNIAQELLNSIARTDLKVLTNCNPTAGNGAISFAIALGFKNISLMGLDLGQKSDIYHHSKQTLYYKSQEFKTKEIQSTITAEGNFGGKIHTTILLDQSKFVLENILTKNREITCYNCSDGVLIRNTIPTPINELEKIIDKNAIHKTKYEYIKSIIHDNTTTLKITPSTNQISSEYKKKWLSTLKEIQLLCTNDLSLKQSVTNITDLYNELNIQFRNFNTILKDKPIVKNTLTGSFNSLQLHISTILLAYQNSPHFSEHYNKMRLIWNDYFDTIIPHCIENIDKTNDQIDISSFIRKAFEA